MSPTRTVTVCRSLSPVFFTTIAILLFGVVASAGAQQPAVRVLYLPTTALSTDEETRRFADIIDDAIRREFLLMGLDILDAPDDSDPISAARDQGARLFFESSALVSGRELVMSFRAVDVPTQRTVDAAFVPTIVGVTVLNRIDETVGEFAESLAEFLSSPEEIASIAPFALSVTVNASPDGTEILLPSGELVGTIKDGSLDFPFNPYPVGARLLLTKRMDGYHTEEESIELASPLNTFTLQPLWRQTRWDVNLHSTTGQLAGAGVGVRYHLNPDWWFVAAENYLFYQLSHIAGEPAIGHYDFGIWTGRYLLFGYRSLVRMGAGAGLGVMLSRIKGAEQELFTDFYLNVVTLWAEINTRSLFAYGQIAAKTALGIGNNLLGTGIIDVNRANDSGGPGLTFGVGWKL